MTPLDLIHSAALIAGAALLWTGCASICAPMAPIVLGSLMILGVAYARKGTRS